MSFYLFIAISFYLNIVCKNIVCELGLKVHPAWAKYYKTFRLKIALVIEACIKYLSIKFDGLNWPLDNGS